MHGTATALPASDVRVSRVVEPDGVVAVTVTGTLVAASAFGPVLQLHRTITVRTGRTELALVDVTANVGHRTEQAPILYHVNFGFPFLDPQAFVDGRLLWSRPRDSNSEGVRETWAVMGPPLADDEDVVFEHGVEPDPGGAATLRVASPGPGVVASVGWDTATLPRVHTWRRATRGSYGMAIEPANCSVLGREQDRADGTAPWLEPGEQRRTRVRIAFSPL